MKHFIDKLIRRQSFRQKNGNKFNKASPNNWVRKPQIKKSHKKTIPHLLLEVRSGIFPVFHRFVR